MIILWIIATGLLLAGVFNPYTGLIGNTLYAPDRKENEGEPERKHKSFRLTRER